MTHQIAIIGLGYVGLPLARLFATKYPVVGFDINQKRIAELQAGKDLTLEVEEDLLKSVLVSENPVAEALEATNTGFSTTFSPFPENFVVRSLFEIPSSR